ncbi:hypothetical protein N7495_000846 [Penicillium taxi]|uniref:uncharacterized protein n=1 Tax=Penicillium taxi TaxID=168475 RepID=UPI00254520F8|nr:uncharacterized protein N7495_000846 [Penicillium taxi]KAJ5908164.1 hypothetical protein N7495_000846 [Penicillium taxi]
MARAGKNKLQLLTLLGKWLSKKLMMNSDLKKVFMILAVHMWGVILPLIQPIPPRNPGWTNKEKDCIEDTVQLSKSWVIKEPDHNDLEAQIERRKETTS